MIQLRHSALVWTEWGCVTHFHDGTSFGAHPHDTHHYAVISHRCGYGDGILTYAREHELAHLLIEEELHDRPSRILWGLAHNNPLPAHEAVYEEMGAQALQRFARAKERPIIGGVQWGALARRFHELTENVR